MLLIVGVERSFSTMNRLWSRLRQRLTSDHLHNLLLIAQEGPEIITRAQLQEIIYHWHSQRPRRIQLDSATSNISFIMYTVQTGQLAKF